MDSPSWGSRDVHHHPHDAAGGVELARLLALGDVGEAADQVFVGVTEDIGADGGIAEGNGREALDEVLEDLVGEQLTVAPVGRPENPVEGVGVGPLYLPYRVGKGGADVGRGLADVPPMAALGDLEAMDLGEERGLGLAEGLGGLGGLLIPDIADPLEEEQGQDVALPVGPVNGTASEDIGTVPEVRFETCKFHISMI